MAMRPGTYLVLGVFMAAGVVAIIVSLIVRKLAISQIRAGLPASPLQILERRLASGDISDEQYQYERYLLEQKK
jgi:uncharacterized membrane protein